MFRLRSRMGSERRTWSWEGHASGQTLGKSRDTGSHLPSQTSRLLGAGVQLRLSGKNGHFPGRGGGLSPSLSGTKVAEPARFERRGPERSCVDVAFLLHSVRGERDSPCRAAGFRASTEGWRQPRFSDHLSAPAPVCAPLPRARLRPQAARSPRSEPAVLAVAGSVLGRVPVTCSRGCPSRRALATTRLRKWPFSQTEDTVLVLLQESARPTPAPRSPLTPAGDSPSGSGAQCPRDPFGESTGHRCFHSSTRCFCPPPTPTR